MTEDNTDVLNKILQLLIANNGEMAQIRLAQIKFDTHIQESQKAFHELDKRADRLERENLDIRKDEDERKAKQNQIETEQRNNRKISVSAIIGFVITLLLFAANLFLKR